MKLRKLSLLLAALVLVGCTQTTPSPIDGTTPADGASGAESTDAAPTDSDAPADLRAHFSDRDRAGDYDADRAVKITLAGSEATVSGAGAQARSGVVTIGDEGIYLLTGSFDGMIVVDAEKTDKVQLVLDGASVTSATSAALYVRQADKVFLTLAEGSENLMANGGSFVAIDEYNIDGAIFARDDLTLNGRGKLTVNSPAGHGVVAKDELVIAGGSYAVTAASHGFSANDSICLADADLTVTAGKDGLKAEHDEDAALGYIVVESGTVTVTADGDGLSAGAYLQIAGGSFNLTTGGGHGTVTQSAGGDWGWDFGGRGGMGGFGGYAPSASTATDTASAKGIKATGDLLIAGGSIVIDAADDALHSNANLTVTGGELTLASGDDGIHADAATTIAGGKINITASYEGIEGLSITVSGGETTLIASDDGLNAAGGADQSGFGGFFGGGRGGKGGGDAFSAGGDSSMFVTISGGKLYVDAGGDGLDSNGALTVTGGETYVAGPTNGGNGPLDYTTGGTITGGTLIAVGAAQMAQNFSAAEHQGAFLVTLRNGTAGSAITLTDAKGNAVFSWTSPKAYSSVLLSCPALQKGETYTLTAGSASTEITMTDLIVGNLGGFGGMGGGMPPGMGGGMPGGGRGGRP